MELSNMTTSGGPRRKRKRVGRGPGSGNGKTAGKGHKGAQARSGYARRFEFEGGQMPLNRRLPKRGFRHQRRNPIAIVNIDLLDKEFPDGAEINSDSIFSGGLTPRQEGGVKLLGRGETSKKFKLTIEQASPSARRKIEAAGGTIEETAPVKSHSTQPDASDAGGHAPEGGEG